MKQASVPICDYEGSSWRSEFWPGREYEDRAERIALSHLLPSHGKRLVEIGAGFGRLAELYRGYDQVILLDYAHSMLRDARSRLGYDPRFVLVAADLYNLPLAESAVDTAVTVRVLHHIVDIPCAFEEVSRVVRPRGSYVTDFANKRHLKAIVKYWLRRGNGRQGKDGKSEASADSPFSLTPYEFVKLNFDYHPRFIEQNLNRVSLQVSDRRAVSTFRFGPLKRLFPPDRLAELDGLIQRPTAALQLSPSLFLQSESVKPGPPVISASPWRCIRCKGTELTERPDGLFCRSCHAVYPLRDGIFDFRAKTE